MPLKLIKRHKSPNWYIRGTVRGIAIDESTGTVHREQAEAFRSKREWEITQGAIFGRRAVATFLQAAVGHMEAGGSPRYLEKIVEYFGSSALSKIDQDAIDLCARTLYPGRKPATLMRQCYAPISAVLNFASERKWSEKFTIKRPRLPAGKTRWLTHGEAHRLIEACSPHMQPLVIFLFFTGARLSEALYLDWKNIDLVRGHVSFEDTKNGESRGVPLHPMVKAALSNMRHRIGAVFRRNDGKPYEERFGGGGQIKTGFNGACRRAGIIKFTPHDCRHTWATWHYAANRDLIGLMKLGGWKSEKMVLRYTHVNVEQLVDGIIALPTFELSAKKAVSRK